MLFEKIPGLYGSGVVPARFHDFKDAIYRLIMEQFFTQVNIEKFFRHSTPEKNIDLVAIIDATDFSPAFDALLSSLLDSALGKMLSKVGGELVLQTLEPSFTRRMKAWLKNISKSQAFQEIIGQRIADFSNDEEFRQKIEEIVQSRLQELTPQMVKQIIQKMIQQHLGWLVVWGGVFGGIIGLTSALLSTLLSSQ